MGLFAAFAASRRAARVTSSTSPLSMISLLSALTESDFAAIVAKHAPKTVLDEPLRVDILAVMPRPKRLTRKSDPDGLVWCTTKPDADNIRKAVLDAMSAWWRDDALICAGETLKVYAGKGRVPCVAVRVRSGLDVATSVWITGFSSEGR